MGRLLIILFVCSLFVAGNAHDVEAKPTKKEEASQRFQRGVELYDSGDLRAALIEFRRAYKLVPTYQLLYNMAQVAAELKDYVEAYDYYKLYLRKGRDKIDTDRRSEVEGQIEQLEGYLASLRIVVSEDDAEITIDGVVVGISPIAESFKVSAGRRDVVVSRRGFSTWERKLDLAGRDSETIDVELISLRTSADETAPNPFLGPGAVDKSKPRYSRAFWASATITALLAGGTAVAALQTLRAKDVYEEQLAFVPNSAANIRLAGDDLRQLALITDIALGLTVVGAISTVLLGRQDAKDRRSAGIQMQLGPTNVAVVGRF